MESRGFLHALYDWFYRSKPLDGMNWGLLAGLIILLVVGIVSWLAVRNYKRATVKWKRAGGETGEAATEASPDDAALPQHHWRRVKRSKGHHRHRERPPHIKTDDW